MTKDEAVKAYDLLVLFRQLNLLLKTSENPGKVETHHILPISCRGEDVPENRINLLAKEHFMAHVYLWIIHHEDEFHYLTMCALNMMVKGSLDGSRKELRDFILMSEEYHKAREEFALFVSKTVGKKITGKNNGVFGKHWYYDPVTLSCTMLFEEDVPNGWKHGSLYVDKWINAGFNAISGKIWIYNPTTGKTLFVDKDTIIPDGFVKGRMPFSEITKEKMRIAAKNKEKSSSNPDYLLKKIEFLRPRYAYYLEFGFDAMAKKFDYPYTYANFSMLCKAFLPEYVKRARDKLQKKA